MADKLMFPIGFDLESAVKNATQDWEKTYQKKLETAIGKKPVAVKLTFDTKLDKLEDVKKRLAQLKIEPITPETKSAIQTLTRELQSLAKALEKIQKLNATKASASSPDAVRAARINEINQRAADRTAIANEKARAAAARAEAAELRLAQARQRSINSIKAQNQAYSSLGGYVERLVKRLAVYYSLQQVDSFLTKVREVTAQFELQRVSLGAIIQDQNRANQLFSEIKSFALKSPLKIMDLTTYTKQVAAYRIETDKLFDTTKRLADVSVGLGVDMGRLVLAYGQVKAASYLRAAEIRQFTEAGIPMLELLAEKFTELQGKMVSTEQVMDLVSKRAVSFSMVEEIFNDMTSAGGMFYNMQEKQGNTLFGMWSKLGDAASVMYDEIGNTESVNEAMKTVIELSATMMRNWRLVGGEILVAAGAFTTFAVKAKIAAARANALALQTAALNKVRTAGIAYNAVLAEEQRLLKSGSAAQLASVAARKANAKAALDAAIAERTAAQATTVWGRAWNSLKSAFLGNWVTILITAIAAIGVAIYSAYEKATRLKRALDEVKSSAITESDKSVRNFESLANAAVKAADGSKAQRDALEELKNTYGKIIPLDDLKIEKLRALKGNYEELTQAIRDNIAQQKLQEGIGKIEESYGADIQKYSKRLTAELNKGLAAYVGNTNITEKILLSEAQMDRIKANVERLAKETGKTYSEIFAEALHMEGIEGKMSLWGTLAEALSDLTKAYRGQETEIKNLTKDMNSLFPQLGMYADYLEKAKEKIENMTIISEKGTFAYDKEVIQKSAEAYISAIRDALVKAKANIKLEDYIKVEADGTKVINFDSLQKAIQDGNAKLKPQLLNFVGMVRKAYDGLIPSDAVTQAVRNNLIGIGNAMVYVGNQSKAGMDVMKKYLWDGKGSIEDHLKTLKDASKELEAEIYKYSNYIKQFGFLGKMRLKLMGVDVDALTAEYDALNKQIKYVQGYVKEDDKKNKRSGTKSDTRLQTLNEIEQALTAINSKYDELLKKEGETKALKHINDIYRQQLKYVNSLGTRFGLKFEMPTSFDSLQDYRNSILKVIEKLKKSGLKGADKAALELQMKIGTSDVDKAQQEIEKEIKNLQYRISRTKTAKEFFDKVLSMTGDYEMSADITMSVYGDTGEGLQDAIIQQITQAFQSGKEGVDIDLSPAIDFDTKRIDYAALRKIYEKYQDALIDKNKDTAKKLVEDGEKLSASQVQVWLKDLEKAKTYADKRVELELYTANKIAEIRASNLPQERKEEYIKDYEDRLAEELSKLQYDAFKDSPMYVHLFESLDAASTTMLTNMRNRLESLKTSLKGLDPTQIKEIQKRIEEIDNQLISRNPFKSLVNDIKALANTKSQAQLDANLIASTKELAAAEERLAAATKEYNEAVHDRDVAADDVKSKREALQTLKDAGYAEDSPEVKEAQELLRLAIERYNIIVKTQQESISKAKENLNAAKEEFNTQKETNDAAQAESETREKNIKNIKAAVAAMEEYQDQANEALSGIRDMVELFGGDEIDMQFFDDIVGGLNKIYDAGQAAAMSYASFASGDIFGGITSGVSAITGLVSGFSSLFNAGKVKRANKEIKKQKKILEQLEYSYNRLGVAADKALGADWIDNFNKQKRVLERQKVAYEKMAAAERSKGKDEDKAKTQEYLNAAQDIRDQIEDLEGQVAAQMIGTDLTSAARDFAQAWIDAYKEFSSTSDAMKQKFQEMMQSFVVNSVLAQVMQKALEPVFNLIDDMSTEDFYDESFWKHVSKLAAQGAEDADRGATTLMRFLEQAGINIKGTADGLTGISRDIASASEESITGLAAGINTQNFYISQIYANVAIIAQIMQGGYMPMQTEATDVSLTDLVTLQNQHLANLPQIATNTAATVERCERAAVACEEILVMLGRVVKPRGVQAAFAISTNLN